MIRVLHITYAKPSFGGPYYAAKIIQDSFKGNKKYNHRLISFEYKKLLKYFFFKKKKLIKLFNFFDIVHMHNIFNPQTFIFSNILKSLSIPYIISPHGNLNIWSMNQGKIKKYLFLFFLKDFFFKSSAIHFLNIYEKREAKKFINVTKMNNYILPNVINDEMYKVKNQKQKQFFKILFFGRFHPKKGIFEILDTIKEIKIKKISNIKFLFVGPKVAEHYDNFLKKIDDYKIGDLIEIRDPVYSFEEKNKLFEEVDIFILPSKDEGDSISIKEALITGTPIIISKECKFPVNKNNKNFVKIIDAEDSKSLFKEIIAFKSYKNDLKNVKYQAHEYIIKNFSKNKIYYALNDIYLDCLTYSQSSKLWISE